MATALNGAIIESPDQFDEQDEADMTMKGHLSNVIVRVDDGRRFELHFIEPERLAQELEQDAKAGTPYFAEPGLIVIPKVTLSAVRATIERLAAGHYFRYLMPVALDSAVTDQRLLIVGMSRAPQPSPSRVLLLLAAQRYNPSNFQFGRNLL